MNGLKNHIGYGKNSFVLWGILLLTSVSVTAQDDKRKELETKRLELKKEIGKIQTYLDNTKRKERSLNSQVLDLNKKMATRQNLIKTISDEVNFISDEMDENTKTVKQLETELNILKKDYAALIYRSYKNRSEENRLLFLLSSKNFYQGFQRFQYMKQYTNYRKKQGDSIKSKILKIQVLNDSLKIMQESKNELVDEKKHEKKQIDREKQKQKALARKYRRQKQKYQSQIRKKQKEEQQLTQQIENLIRTAIKKSGTTAKGFALTPEVKALSNKFASNKGKLPWPVEKGLVTLRFGSQSDPVDPKLKLHSSGVRIATHEKAEAKAVFDGKVLGIQKNPQTGVLSVLIQHGNYISVYANLERLFVTNNQKVKTKQTIGIIHTDKITGKTILKFQIWKNLTKQNPEVWIYKM